MSELEQLKADLEAFQNSRKIAAKFVEPKNMTDYLNIHNRAVDTIQAKIKELEAPPDPFREAKRTIARQRSGEKYNSNQVDYAIYLEDENARLKAENAELIRKIERKKDRHGVAMSDRDNIIWELKEQLENRPVVWCLKTSTGSLHTSDVNNTTRLFHSMTDALSYAAKHGYHWLKADIYTGKESE